MENPPPCLSTKRRDEGGAPSSDQFVCLAISREVPIFRCGGLLSVLEKGLVGTAAEVLFQLHDADAAEGGLIGQGDEAASRSGLDRHLRNH